MRHFDSTETRRRRPLGCTLAALALVGTAYASPVSADADLAQRVDTVIDRWVESERIVGAVAMIARDGEIVYRRAAGHADREAGIPAREDTIFRLASMSKAIVSATAMALIEEGNLSLDDTVARWLPWFTPALADGARPDITVRQLMTHTSGLSYEFFEPKGNAYEAASVPWGLDASGTMTLDDALCRLASVPLVYEPGTQWRYSLSTDVLGGVIQAASGMPLGDAVRHYVTGPLGMEDTSFVVSETGRLAPAYRDGDGAAIRMNPAHDYLPVGDGIAIVPARAYDPAAYPSGGGGMSGTAEEYLRFLEALRTGGGPILAPSSAAALAEHAIGDLRAWTEGEGWGFSLGSAVLLDPEVAGSPQNPGTWQWAGALGSHFFVDPEAQLSVVVLTNTAVAGGIGAFPAELRDAIYARESG